MGIPPEVGASPLDDPTLSALDALLDAAAAAGRSPAEALLADDDPTGLVAEVRRWAITDERAAEWAMRMVAKARAEVAHAQQLAAEWHAEVDAWLAAQLGKPEATAAFFASHLEQYGLEYRALTGKATLKLPSGEVRTTDRKPAPTITDPGEVVQWLRFTAKPEQLAKLLRQADPEPVHKEAVKLVRLVPVAVDGQVLYACGTVYALAAIAGGDQVDLDDLPVCPDHGEGCAWDDQLLHVELQVRDLDGDPAPGWSVKPREVSAKVVPA